MKAIIPAAGKGTRMLPLTEKVPKPLLEVLGKPLLEYIFESLPEEVDEVLLVVGYKGAALKEHFGTMFGNKTIRYIEQSELLGTADALRLCRPYLTPGERFLLLFADDIYDRDSIKRCLAHSLSMLVASVDDPRRYGVVELAADNRIIGIEEKPKNPKSNLVAPGVYILDTRIFDYPLEQSATGEYYLTTMLERLLCDYPVYAEHVRYWLTFAYPEDLTKAEKLIQQGVVRLP